MSTPILDQALELVAHGYSVVPIRADGTKRPAIATWKPYQEARPTEEQVRTWFTDTDYDLAVPQGTVSMDAELTEIEGRGAAAIGDLASLAKDSGLGDLWERIVTGWVERSPSGGIHFHYRLDFPVPGNTKLARNADGEVVAETRGEGGYVIVAPSSHHPSGRTWQRLIGGPATAPTITLDERDAFHSILRTLDEHPHPETPTDAPKPRNPEDGIPPGDDYENRTDWTDILTPAGWAFVFARGTTRYWRRPGKNIGISATTGHADDRDRLYVFTSSTDFTPETPYTKFGAYAVLHHGGDHSAAARALAAAGYGERPQQARTGPAGAFTDLVHPDTLNASSAPPQGAPVVVKEGAPTSYTETDDGNALRLVDTYGHEIRYCPQRGAWLGWDGHRWRWDEARQINELARTIARNLPMKDGEAKRHRKKSLSRNGVENMVALARSDARTSVHLSELDARPFELNTPGGVIDLRTGNITPADPAALHTRSTAIAPDMDGTAPKWLNFLADTFAGDPDLTAYIQRTLGVSLVGQVLEQVLPFAYGSGANGKTTLLEVVQRVIGIGDDGYAISAPAELLLASHVGGHPTEIARLSGARLVVTSELEDGQRFAEARIKQLTGRDVISGRFMRQDWFSFVPTHTIWLLANHQPNVRAGGDAFWRRLRLIPFEHTVPPERREADLGDRLFHEEGPAILGWLIRGAADYFKHGAKPPEAVVRATDAYAAEEDALGKFIADRCELGHPTAQHMAVRTSELRQAYETWCRQEGEEPISAKALGTALATRFHVEATRAHEGRYYRGIRLADGEENVSRNASRNASQGTFDDVIGPRGREEQGGW